MILGPHTITVLRAPQVQGDYGTGTTLDWANATETDIPGCSVQPVAAGEYIGDRDTTTTRWQAWVPSDGDLLSTDRVTWAGDTYDVDGEPQRWAFPPLDHQVVLLRRSEEAAQ